MLTQSKRNVAVWFARAGEATTGQLTTTANSQSDKPPTLLGPAAYEVVKRVLFWGSRVVKDQPRSLENVDNGRDNILDHFLVALKRKRANLP